MIISHRHKYIFFHGLKTAGSSINFACSRSFGPRDELTATWHEILAQGGFYNLKALIIISKFLPRHIMSQIKNSIINHKLSINLSNQELNKIIKRYYMSKFSSNSACHPTAYAVSQYAPCAFKEYLKFTVVRNPWDQAVSLYYWRTKKKNALDNVSFKEFLYRLYDWNRLDPEGVRPPIQTNWELYTINDQVVADHILKFENLDEEIKKMECNLGIELLLGASKIHSRNRSRSLEWYYDEESIGIVRSIYRKEIEYFDYQLPF